MSKQAKIALGQRKKMAEPRQRRGAGTVLPGGDGGGRFPESVGEPGAAGAGPRESRSGAREEWRPRAARSWRRPRPSWPWPPWNTATCGTPTGHSSNAMPHSAKIRSRTLRRRQRAARFRTHQGAAPSGRPPAAARADFGRPNGSRVPARRDSPGVHAPTRRLRDGRPGGDHEVAGLRPLGFHVKGAMLSRCCESMLVARDARFRKRKRGTRSLPSRGTPARCKPRRPVRPTGGNI